MAAELEKVSFHSNPPRGQWQRMSKPLYNSEKAMAPHSSTLAWKIPWTEEPGRLQSMGLLRVGQDWAFHFHFHCTITLISHVSKVLIKILQARFQRYGNRERPDIQAGFRKGRGTRDQIADIHRIIEQAREFQKSIYFCFINYTKAFDCVDHNKLWNILRDGNTNRAYLCPEKSGCRSRSHS